MKRLLMCIVAAMLLLSFGIAFAEDPVFTGPFAYQVPIGHGRVISADFDGDGDKDLAVTYPGPSAQFGGAVFILTNNGDGTFLPPVSYFLIGTIYLCSGDFDGDDDYDLAVIHGWGTNLSILINNGDGTFQAGSVVSTVVDHARHIFCSDLDGDGDLDLSLTSIYADIVYIYFNNGDATFQGPATYSVGDGYTVYDPEWDAGTAIWDKPDAAFPADLDGDGDKDLAVAGTGLVAILFNNGDGTFGPAINYYGEGLGGDYIVAADFDGDGDNDLACSGPHILLNNGDGSFQAPVSIGGGYSCSIVFATDLDHDGDKDLIGGKSSTPAALVIFLNNGDGSFQSPVNYDLVEKAGPLFVISEDFDGDYDNDIVVSGEETDHISIFLNQLPCRPVTAEATPKTIEIKIPGSKCFAINIDNQGCYDVSISPSVSWTQTVPSQVTVSGGSLTVVDGQSTSVDSPCFAVGSGAEPGEYPLDIIWTGTDSEGHPIEVNTDPTIRLVSVGDINIDIKPKTLNLKSKGKWITCHIDPECSPEDIIANTVKITNLKLNGVDVAVEIPADPSKSHPVDEDGDEVPDAFMAKFSREVLITAIQGSGDGTRVGELVVTVAGTCDGTPFSGTDTIQVIKLSSTSAEGQRSRRFSAGEDAYIKFKFGTANPCFVKGIVNLVDISSGTVLGTFKKAKAVDRGTNSLRCRVKLPEGLTPGTRIKAVLKLKRFDQKGGTLIGTDKDKVVLVIE